VPLCLIADSISVENMTGRLFQNKIQGGKDMALFSSISRLVPFKKDKVVLNHTENQKFGTFLGVFVPCILMLFGVIIFLRLGWIVGQVGPLMAFIIITLAVLIALITALSMAAISTNIEVGKGGVYYMLSRSLGIEAGSAVGSPLFLKQALSIAFCVIGFAESLNDLIPSWPIQTIGICTLAALTILAYKSVRGALKVQVVIFIAILASLVSFFTGTDIAPMHSDTFSLAPLPSHGFWVIFALFFPAMTGVESSVSLSGDLRFISCQPCLHGTVGCRSAHHARCGSNSLSDHCGYLGCNFIKRSWRAFRSAENFASDCR
jgi:Amino acid permease